MVAHLIRLKAALLANGFRRSPWQLVGVVLGGLYAVFLVAMLLAGQFLLGSLEPAVVSTATVAAVSLLALGWTVVPVLLTGIDLTLDPTRFATFAVPPSRLVAGLLAGQFIGVPGAATLVVLAGLGLSWRAVPAAAAAAVVCGLLAAALCVVLARVVTTAAASLAANRRVREAGTVLLFVPLVLLGPITARLEAGVASAGGWLEGAAAVAGWTPWGAFAAVPADVATGQWATAAARLALALGYLGGGLLLWRRMLVAALEAPPRQAAGGSASGLGPLGRAPAAPWGAVAARALVYWLKDPRYAAGIVVVPLLPVVLWWAGRESGSELPLLLAAPVVATMLAFSISADVSYDSTAFALHVVSGVRGIDDRLGRVAACAAVSLPAVLLLAVAPPLAYGRPGLVPVLLGLSLGALLTGLGVASVASARFTYGVPQPGESPFKTPPGAGVRMAVVQLAVFGTMAMLLAPEIALGAAAWATGSAPLAWATLACGLGLGGALLVAGIRVGGRWFDARLPELMQATVRNR